MMDAAHAGIDELPPSLGRRVDEACIRFEKACKGKQAPRIEDYLDVVAKPERSALFHELLRVELAYSNQRGEKLSREGYQRRFPEHSGLINAVFEEALATRPPIPGETPPRAVDLGPKTEVGGLSQPPVSVGRYRVAAKLGSGGFGVVYKGYDEDLRREVAIKIPHPDLIASRENADAYLAEARLLARLDHPGIVPIYDVGRSPDGNCYIVSKFVSGNDLRRRLKESRPAHAEAVEIVAQVAEALHYAHQRGLVHRDIKPANILLDAAGRAIVTDFGLALPEEEFGTGPDYAGTPAYMSPEQARGEGHRVDARSDVYSLGIVFYELLTGQRPLRPEARADLLEQINLQEPRPPRQLDDTIPKELDRICLKALCKHARDRYSTAIDMAEDLRFWQAGQSQKPAFQAEVMIPPAEASASAVSAPAETSERQQTPLQPTPVPSPSSDSDLRPIHMVPKGLRSFDARDADFFLELLPGPRDRDGLPESIRFWKTRIESEEPDDTFSVGLVYGPSGCGKSSLVKAGLLPRLAGNIVAIYVEATSDKTEWRLLKGIRKRCPDLPAGLGLVETLANLRKGRGLPRGKKVLLVLDQFEHWLHTKRNEENTELVQALRQCDGQRLQCLILVRDDFGMAVTRVMRSLEVPIVEGENFATVDLFAPRHARKVLYRFGCAFGVLPDLAAKLTAEQQHFLDQAVTELEQNGKVICVKLALFAEMIKEKPWLPTTLKEVGGTQGLGVTFLEEMLGDRCANPEHRIHRHAIRAVLKALLPDQGTDLKGHMRSHQELLEISGYSRWPQEFDELMHILDTGLRLVTPTDPEGLALEQEEATDTHSDEKYYQLTHDYLVPALRRWLTQKQRETRRGRAELRLAERAALWNARPETHQLPSWWEWWNIELFTRSAHWTEPQRKMMQSATHRYVIQTIAVTVVLLGLGLLGMALQRNQAAKHADLLVRLLLDADVVQVPKIIAEIEHYRPWTNPRLKEIVDDSTRSPKERLHARLALLPDDRGRTEALLQPLADVLLDYSRPESERDVVASSLANYVADQTEFVAQLAVEAEPRQAALLLKSLRDHREQVIPSMKRQLEIGPTAEMPEAERNRLVKRQATAAVALLQFGQEQIVWPLFQQSSDLRTYLIHRLAPLGTDPKAVIRRLKNDQDSAKMPVILCLGEFPYEGLSAAERTSMTDILLEDYRSHPSAGIHSAAEWLLRRWKCEGRLRELDEELKSVEPRAARRWYTNLHGHTMVLIDGPGHFQMGSPPEDPDRYDNTELLHTEPIRRPYAMATKEVTVAQFEQFLAENPDVTDFALGLSRRFTTYPDGPVLGVTWYQAAQYCRWLSEKEGISNEQMCYPKVEEIRKAFREDTELKLPSDYLSRTAYRLPTEAEWEYACRAKTATSRPYGASDEMLDYYAWYSRNSAGRACAVGTLKPNDFGLFDMLGNASEWTNNEPLEYSAVPEVQQDRGVITILKQDMVVVFRGGSFNNPAPQIRSAHRFKERAAASDVIGFRIARTHR